MTINRRDFFRKTGWLAATLSVPLNSVVFAGSTPERLFLSTGLSTDEFVVKGLGAQLCPVEIRNPKSYAKLIAQCQANTHQAMFSLLQTGDAFLLEEAFRDAHISNVYSQRVTAPEAVCSSKSECDAQLSQWAENFGKQLSLGSLPQTDKLIHSHSSASLTLVLAQL